MIDLAALFQEASAEHSGTTFPGFPVSGKGRPERQPVDRKAISGVFGVSGSVNKVNRSPDGKDTQARASAGTSGRARGAYVQEPEIPETPEKLVLAREWLSGFSLGKSEKERGTGNRTLPPAAPASFDERAAFLEYECGLSRPAEAQARVEFGQPASPAPLLARLPSTDGLALWRAGVALLSPAEPPCPGYKVADRSEVLSGEWPRVLAQAIDFLDTFGPQAEILGWTARRLFGVHPSAGIVRVDCCGALVMPCAGTVRAITAKDISFGHLTHREKPGQPTGVPIWEFGR